MVTVTGVTAGSLADAAGIQCGDILLEINGHPINDVLDYRFYLTERHVTLLLHRGPELVTASVKKGEYDDIGLDFESFLMDGQKTCRNRCVFCFIDQLPRGMRKSLYFKDDDSRMSFLAGSYVTLTNMSEADIDRIIQMRISPIHISVHTTDPELRVRMMRNPNAGQVLEIMQRFAEAGIEMHAQIVLCRGWNDGAALDRSMRDLGRLYPSLQSVSVVPIGLTCHREGLCHMEPFDAESAKQVLAQIAAFADSFYRENGTRLVFASDEWYLKADCPLPEEEAYEGYPQLDNGVGMIRSMHEEIGDAVLNETADGYPGDYSVATGYAAYDFLSETVAMMNAHFPGTHGQVWRIRNDFFGEQITVAGLITGRDLVAQLAGKPLGKRLLLPYVMLRHERDRFLDDMTPDEVERALGVPLVFVENDGYDLVEKILHGQCNEESEGKDGERNG